MAEENPKKNRRRKILIDKAVQLRYTLLLLALIIVYSSSLGYSFYTNYKTGTKLLLANLEDNPKLKEKLEKNDRMQGITIIVGMVINALVITYIGIFSTHKIAGPIYRFRKHIQSMKEGDLSIRTKLRKNDLLNDIADDLNQTSEKMKAFFAEDISKVEMISDKIRKLNEAIRKNQIDLSDASIALNDINSDTERFISMKKKFYGIEKAES